jgi:hypothetical protein
MPQYLQNVSEIGCIVEEWGETEMFWEKLETLHCYLGEGKDAVCYKVPKLRSLFLLIRID